MEVTYSIVDSPLGELLLAATEKGLVRVAFAVQNFDAIIRDIERRLGARISQDPNHFYDISDQLDSYFARKRSDFTIPFDYALTHGFRHQVQLQLLRIRYGQTQTYATVAKETDHPKAVRAVGTACAQNPLPIVVPCHRVVRSDGTLGGYAGGLAVKSQLLQIEQANIFKKRA